MKPPAPRTSSVNAGLDRLETARRKGALSGKCHATHFGRTLPVTHFRLELLVLLKISSGFKLQFFRFPLTKPEMMTNTSTTTLMLVKTLLTQADSFTPNASRPEGNRLIVIRSSSSFKRESSKQTSVLSLTCEDYYDEDSEYVWILRQDAGSVHRHVLPAEFLDVFADHLVKGRAPRPGHARRA